MKENLRPLGKLLLVQRTDAAKESEGGLFIPEAARELPTEGIILEVGERVETKVVKGDKVIFGKYSGTKVVHQGREFLLLQEDELLGVLETSEEVVH